MCRSNERTHKHHIIPRYMGGPDTPENLVEVTVTQHAMFHFCNYQLWGNEEDRLAWRGLSGLITTDEVALEAMSLGGKKGGNKHKENKTGICGMTSEELSEVGKKGGKIAGNKCKENKIGICGMTSEEKGEAGKKATSQKWQCTETGYTSTACGLTHYQNKRGIDTTKRIKVDGSRAWKIIFEDGRVVVTYQTLKDWTKENGYSYDCLRDVRRGKIKNHKSIIKVVPF